MKASRVFRRAMYDFNALLITKPLCVSVPVVRVSPPVTLLYSCTLHEHVIVQRLRVHYMCTLFNLLIVQVVGCFYTTPVTAQSCMYM